MNLGPYQDNYGEVRKVNSRKAVVPLKYKFKHKAKPDEIVLDIEKAMLYAMNDNYELIPIGGGNGINVLINTVSVTSDTNIIDTGLNLSENSTLIVTQNGMRITEGRNYTINGNNIIKMNGVWNGDLEEIIFTFTLFENGTGGYTPPSEDIILPPGGENGQILIKTSSGMAWADVDITNDSYNTIVANTLGTDYILEDASTNNTSSSVQVPTVFPQNGISGQTLTRTVNGMAWADVDITQEVYENIVTDTIGNVYIVDITQLANAINDTSALSSTTIPDELPQNGTDGQILYKTAAGVEWKDLDLTDTSYRTIISNTLGDSYIK